MIDLQYNNNENMSDMSKNVTRLLPPRDITINRDDANSQFIIKLLMLLFAIL